jgi:hypothetical protein
MGLSLENLLSSSITKSLITPEILSIYGDVNPTHPKQKALDELDSKLTEVNIQLLLLLFLILITIKNRKLMYDVLV